MSWFRAALVIALLAIASVASAAHRHFEPDDLELEKPGIFDIDLQAGPLHGDSVGKNHVMLPDFELGLGLLKNVQLEIDGTFGADEFDRKSRHYTGDPLWLATKLGLYVDEDKGTIWAVGLELGPRLPTLDAAGVGYGAVALIGYSHGGFQLVLNAGGLLDPGATLSAERPRSLVVGLDLNLKLNEIWSIQGELGSAYYLSPDPHELAATLGATYAVTPKLDVSATALAGFLPNTQQLGILLGV